jgi:hypothetical protein
MSVGVDSSSETDHQIKNDEQSAQEERESAQNQESTTRATPISEAHSNEEHGNPEQQHRAEQWKIRREWLTIFGLFLAAGAAFYQGHVLSKQADTLNGQLLEMKNAGIQSDKLIQSNADLATAAKAQAIAEQQTAAAAHDTLSADVRARIAAGNVSLTPIQTGQPLKATLAYSNLGKEPAPIDVGVSWKRWTKADWANGGATTFAATFEASCLALRDVRGDSVAYPSVFGSGYSNIVQSDESGSAANNFVGDDEMPKSDAIIALYSCYTYRTLSEIHHTVGCNFYLANSTPGVGTLNICRIGNAAD